MKEIRVILGAVLFGIFIAIPLTSSRAQSASVSVETYPTTVAHDGGSGGTGTPFAVFVRISDWKQHADETAYIRVHEAVGSWSNYYHYTAEGTWSRAAGYAPDHYPTLQLDGSGNAEGWIVLKSPSDKQFSTFTVRARADGSSGACLDLGLNRAVAAMDMTSAGAWIRAEASGNMAGKTVAAIGGNGVILGTALIEDNGVEEGYQPTPGFFRMAVPANTSIPILRVLSGNHTVASSQSSSHWSSGAPGTETDLDLHDEVSLPVGVVTFEAVWSDGSVMVRWKTESESQTLGYYLWRSERSEGAFRRISPEMIERRGETGSGAEYTFTDRGIGLKRFWYRLEEVYFTGESVFVGPVQAVHRTSSPDLERAQCANYPNPFYPSTLIRYSVAPDVPHPECVKVFDVRGRELVTLTAISPVDGKVDVYWNGRDAAGREVADGVYFCCLVRQSCVVETARILKAR